jgi:hypothetical protein
LRPRLPHARGWCPLSARAAPTRRPAAGQPQLYADRQRGGRAELDGARAILGVERGDFDRLILGYEHEPVCADDLREFRHQLGCLLVVQSNGEGEHLGSQGHAVGRGGITEAIPPRDGGSF